VVVRSSAATRAPLVKMLRPVVGESGGQHLALTRIVVSRTADPATSFSRVRGLEVTPLAYAREFLRGDVLRGEAIDILNVEADRGSGGNVVRFRLETI